LPIGKAIQLREGKDVSILAVGRMVEQAQETATLLAASGIEASVYNMLWVKPIDKEAVVCAAASPLVVTLEEGTIVGGFGAAVLEVLARDSAGEAAYPETRVLNMGVRDGFVGQGGIGLLLEELGLTAAQIAERIRDVLKREAADDAGGIGDVLKREDQIG
jgi:transketolase C-terminal domain/subunit